MKMALQQLRKKNGVANPKLQRAQPWKVIFLALVLTSVTNFAIHIAFSRALYAQEELPLARITPFANQTPVPHPMPVWQPPLLSTGMEEELIAYDLQTRTERLVTASPHVLQAAPYAGSPGAATSAEEVVATTAPTEQAPARFSPLQPVSNVLADPWRAAVKLFVYHDELGSNQHYECSGALIDPFYVITAGDCVFDQTSTPSGYGWATEIWVAPAYANGNVPDGYAVATNEMFSFRGWTESRNYDWAIGYIRLDRPVGALAGWYGYGYHTADSYYQNNTFQNPGYPALTPYNGEQMYNWAGAFDFVYPERLEQSNLLNDGGFAGSGAFVNDNNRWIEAVPTYLGAGSTTTGYTRLTQSKFEVMSGEIDANVPRSIDLLPLDVTVSPTTIAPGERFPTLDYLILNYSTQSWNGVVDVEVYLSTDATISTQDTWLKTETTFSNSGDVETKGRLRITSGNPPRLPTNLAPGQYWIGVILKDANSTLANNASNGWDAAAITVIQPATATPTASPTAPPTMTPTVRPTATATAIPTATPTCLAPTATATPTVLPTVTPTPITPHTVTATATATDQLLPTATTEVPPTSTATATETPTVASKVPATDTPTETPATPIDPGATSKYPLYLPVVAQMPPPPPTPTLTPTITPIPLRRWQQIAGVRFNVAKLALYSETLLAGTRGTDATRGLYSGNSTTCQNGVSLGRVRAIPESSVLGLAFQGLNGVATAFDHSIYYTNDGGSTWTPGTPAISHPRTVAVVTNLFFVGTEDNGIYLSRDNGHTWEQRRNEPGSINVVKLDVKAPEMLWIGTDTEGVYSLRVGATDTLLQNKAGLSGDALKVWDFAFETTQIYLATLGGVFVGDGVGPWAPFGPSPAGVQFYSLELVGTMLYAGASNNGVWRKALTSGAWERVSAPGWNETATVRDLLYDNTTCHGLLAATDDGIWLYR